MTSEQVPGQKAALVERLLAGVVTAVARYPGVVLTVALVFTLISVYGFCNHLSFHTQRNDLISPDKDYLQRWRQYIAEFGDDEDMVVVVEGNDKERMKAALEAVAERVRAQPDLFDRLFYKVDLRGLSDRALLFLPLDQIKGIQENLQSMRPLLDMGPLGWHWFTFDRLVQETAKRTAKLEPGQAPSEDDQQFLTQIAMITGAATEALDNPSDYKNPWRSILAPPPEQQDLMAQPQYFFSGDDGLAFLLVRPVKQGGVSFTAAQANVAALRQIIAEEGREFADLELGLTGLPVLETDEMIASQNDTQYASWLALGGVTLLFFLVFRNWRSPLLTVTTLLVGTIWAMGWLTLTVGHLNILSATFAMMLIGMGDYGVLWLTRYELERRDGTAVLDSLRETARSVGPGILTAAVTTALAFYAAMLADFQAVAELGWVAGSGVLLCAVSCFTVMPALLVLLDRRCEIKLAARYADKPVIRHVDRPWLPGLVDRPWWVIGGGVAATLVLGLCALTIKYDHNLLNLQAKDLDSVKWELKLIERTSGASWHALSITDSREQALALKARFEELSGVSRVVEVASLVPLDQGTKLAQMSDIQHRLRHLPARNAPTHRAPGDTAALKQKLDKLLLQLRSLDRSGTQPALRDLRAKLMALRVSLESIDNLEASRRLCDFEKKLVTDLAEDLHRLRDASHPQRLTVDDLPAALRERYVGKHGQWLLRVFAKGSLWEYKPLVGFVDQIAKIDPNATGKPISTLDGLRTMKRSFQWAGVYALGAIVLVLFWDFRKLRHMLLALAPLGMGVLCALGIMGLCGWPLNPANMIAFPLIVGVGVDNGVHVLHDYLSRRRLRQYTLSHTTGQGIMTAALTTILGFGMLMISSHRGLIGLGFILTLGVGCCMLSALVFLPAVLHVISNRHPEEEKPPQPESVRRAA